MIEIRIPEFPLSQFVECIIHFYGMNPSHSIDRFLPDGNTEIIIELTGRPQYIYDNQTLREKQVCKKAWASGVRTEFFRYLVRVQVSIVNPKNSTSFAITLIHVRTRMLPFRLRRMSGDRPCRAPSGLYNSVFLLRP